MNEVMKPPMVGREDSISRLHEIAEKVLAGNGEVVFIAGEAGIGKTRLAEEFEKIAAELGFQILVGRCIPGMPAPYLPFQEALKEYLEKKDMGLVHFLTGKEFDYTLSFEFKTESEKTLFSMLEFLRKLSARNPLILRIEDLHWVDSASVQIIHFLARNCNGLRVLIIGTYRTEEVESTSGLTHPLMESLRVMRREGICKEIDLRELTRDQVKVAIEGMLGGAIGNDVLEKISAECGGNPLFIVETVRLLWDLNALSKEDGFWQMKAGATIEIPLTVKEVILRRIEKIPKYERRILDCGAVFGERFEPKIVEESLQINGLDLLEKLDSIEKTSQLVMEKDGIYQFGHEIVKRILYDQISPVRRKELHRLIGFSLEKAGASPSNYGILSIHFFNADERAKCIEYSLLAGKGCFWQLSMPEALIYFNRVLDCSSNSKAYYTERIQALEGLADAYSSVELNNCAKALPYYEQCLAEVTDPKVKARLLRKISWCWSPLAGGIVDSAKARALLKEVESYKDLEPSEQAEILITKSGIALFDGDWDEFEGCLQEAESLFERIGSHDRLAMTLADHAVADLNRGFAQRAFEKLERASSINSTHPSIKGENSIDASYFFVHMHRGEYDKSLHLLNKVIYNADKIGAINIKSAMVFYRALLNDIREDFNAEMADAHLSWEMAKISESDYDRLCSAVLLTHSYLRLNRYPEGQKEGMEMLELLKKFDPKMHTPTRCLAEIIRGELCYFKGDLKEGDRRFQDGIKMISAIAFGIFFEAMTRSWYGGYLLRQNRLDDARLQYSLALDLFQKLENRTEVERIQKRLASIR